LEGAPKKKGWNNQPFFNLSTLPWVNGPHSEFHIKWQPLYRFRQIPRIGAAHHGLKGAFSVSVPLGLNNLTNMAESRFDIIPA
jgi:hypothetical protein